MAITLALGCQSSTPEAPTSNAVEAPLPTPTVHPETAPDRPGACLINESAQTWKGSAKCRKGTGQCERSASGELTVQRTGPKSAMISTSGFTDGGATFDPTTCTVSHAHWVPKAPIPVSISYSFVVSPQGRLSGSLHAQVTHSIFGCTGNYSLSGTKK
jgi:hypothetical protein